MKITRKVATFGYDMYQAQRLSGCTAVELQRFYVNWQDFERWFQDDQYNALDPHGEKAADRSFRAEGRALANWNKERT